MTQALAMYKIIQKNDWELITVYAGKSKFRSIPDYFLEIFGSKVSAFKSPNFKRNSSNKGIALFSSLLINITKIPSYISEVKRITNEIKDNKINVVFNFFDPIGGVVLKQLPRNVEQYNIAHQFVYMLPGHIFPSGYPFQKLLLKKLCQIIHNKSALNICLSWVEEKHHLKKNIKTCSPLLGNVTKEVKIKHHLVCVYVLNAGFINIVNQVAKLHSDLYFECYTDQHYSIDATNVKVNKLNRESFLQCLNRSSLVICTTGFELIAECLLLDKPFISFPSENHYEQYSNAHLAEKLKLGKILQTPSVNSLSKAITETISSKRNKEEKQQIERWYNDNSIERLITDK